MNLIQSRKPDVVFKSNGEIRISSRVSKELGINRGDAINIWTDGIEYYLYIQERQAPKGTKLVCWGRGAYLRAQSQELSTKMIMGNLIAGYAVGEKTKIDEDVEALPIITRRNLL
jgi:hypothetical protein